MLVNVIHIPFDENVDDKDTDIVFLLVKDKKVTLMFCTIIFKIT